MTSVLVFGSVMVSSKEGPTDMTSTTDQIGRITRTVTHSGYVHTQVQQSNGEWWNIRVERVAS